VRAGRYVDDAGPGSGRLRSQDAIVDHSRRLADRLGAVLAGGGAAPSAACTACVLPGVVTGLATGGAHR
jgi:arginase